MITIPDHIRALRNYKPGRPNAEGSNQDEKRIISLCSNENNLGPSPKAIEALKGALGNIFKYPDPTALDLRNELSLKLNVKVDQIIPGNGSDNILYTLFNAFFTPGDELLTSQGSFVAIDPMAAMNQVKVVKCPMTADYGFDLDGILNLMSKKTKAIYICNPNNPTGTYLSTDLLSSFLKKVPKDILVIIDEAYFEYARFLLDDYPDATNWLTNENILILRTFSKIYGLAGERIGYAIGSENIINALWKVKPTFSPGILAQKAALTALGDQDHVQLSLVNNEMLLKKYYILFDRFNLVYLKSACNFVTLIFKKEQEALEFHDYLKAHRILVRHLISFGLPNLVRISTGTMDEFIVLEKVMKVYFTKFVEVF